MYLTQSNVIRGLSKEEYSILRETCQYSNNLYNVALYNIRQYYFQDKKFLKYEENYHVCKENENYGLLQAGVSQQTLKGEFSFQMQDGQAELRSSSAKHSCAVFQPRTFPGRLFIRYIPFLNKSR